MNLFERINAFIERHKLIPPHTTIIVGISGGPDSVFLTHYLLSLRETIPFDLAVAHLNHGWRASADHDEQFCKELAQQFGLPFFVQHARDTIDTIPWTGSREEQARTMRRIFYTQITQQFKQARIALAHHQDDQYETFFIRLVRGAGLQGLRGMVPYTDQYIRPLLCVRKDEILEYLRVHNIPFVIDSTNADAVYLRNRIRHQVIPALRTCDNRFPVSLQQTISNLAEADDFCIEVAETTLHKISTNTQNEIWIDVPSFLALHPFLQKQVIIRWLCKVQAPFTASQGLFYEVLKFLQQPQGGRHHVSPHWYLYKKQNRVAVYQTR